MLEILQEGIFKNLLKYTIKWIIKRIILKLMGFISKFGSNEVLILKRLFLNKINSNQLFHRYWLDIILKIAVIKFV
jgi:hypothetical protein